jgi:hypothetical protein
MKKRNDGLKRKLGGTVNGKLFSWGEGMRN